MPSQSRFLPAKNNITLTDFSPRVSFAAGSSGNAVAMGDLDGDNVQDLVIGSRTDTGGGSVRIVYMNTDGSPKSSVLIDSTSSNGPTISSGDWFGNAVANIGDLDGDGITDMAVGAEQDDASSF